eukprot:CFRG5764T1
MDGMDSLLFLEDSFHNDGYQEGMEFGRKAAGEEARGYGLAKGDQLATELGFYRGFATTWLALLDSSYSLSNTDSSNSGTPGGRSVVNANRAKRSLTTFKTTLDNFSMTSSITPDNEELPKLYAKLRTKYRQCTSLLGVSQDYRSAAPPKFLKEDDDAGF